MGSMTLIAILPLCVCFAGLFVYLLASKAEAKEVGRIMFFCGLLVFLFAFDSKHLSLKF